MPLLNLALSGSKLDPQKRATLQQGLTSRMESILGKKANLTVVNITQSPNEDWSVGGTPLGPDAWTASLTAHITTGTNTVLEQAEFIESAYNLIHEVMATPPAAPVYIIVKEIAAHSWGYDGRTQLSRRPVANLTEPSQVA